MDFEKPTVQVTVAFGGSVLLALLAAVSISVFDGRPEFQILVPADQQKAFAAAILSIVTIGAGAIFLLIFADRD